ncbi:MAG TPA: VanZ family protein [Solirubrobacterales bacterium]|jgi:VanZ family protein
MNRRNRALLRAIAPLVLMGVIFYFSAQPSTGEHAWWVVIFRKLGHLTGYALLTALWWWALRPVTRRALPIAVCIALAYACTDEFHQTFVHGRTGTPVDVGIDAIGMAIAAALIGARRLPRARERKRDPAASVPRSSPVP